MRYGYQRFYLVSFAIVSALGLCPVEAISAAQIVTPTVIVGELAWAGSSVSSADEWVELSNQTDQVIDLAGWSLWDTAKPEPVSMVTIDEGQIAPGKTFLLSNNGPDHEFSGGVSVLAVQPDVVTSDLSLRNDALMLQLRDQAGIVLDVVGDGGPGFHRGTDAVRSMVRRVDTVLGGDLPEAWVLASDKAGLDELAPDYGSPTPSGRPHVVLPSSCLLYRDQFSREQGLQLVVTDPDGEAVSIRTETRLDDQTVTSEQTVSAGVVTLSIQAPGQLTAGPHTLNVRATDADGLYRTSSLRCDRQIWNGSVQITEVFASPSAGEVEFIELYNLGDQRAELYGWRLDDADDAGSRPYLITYPLVIEPGQSVALAKSETGLALNNEGDDVQLLGPDGQRVDLVRYSGNQRGQSWNLGLPWYWSSPTPGRSNHGPVAVGAASQGGNPASSSSVRIPTVLPLTDILTRRSLLAGTLIETEATIAVAQGDYHERRLIIAHEQSFVELQVPDREQFPGTAGDRVRVVGSVSRSETPRLLVDSLTNIQIVGHEETPVLQLDTLTSPQELQQVSLAGTIEKSGNTLEVRTGAYSVTLTRRRGVEVPLVTVGDSLQASGIVVSVAPLQIRLLRAEDVTIASAVEVKSTEEVGAVNSGQKIESQLALEPTPSAVTSASLPTGIVGTTQLPPVLGTLSAALLTRAVLLDTLSSQVLGSRTEVLAIPPATPALIVVCAAVLGFLALWGDLLWQYLARRITGQ